MTTRSIPESLRVVGDAPVQPAQVEPTEPTVKEVLAKAVADAEAELAAAQVKVTAARARLAAVPELFHGFSLSRLKTEIEGWFKAL